MKQVKSVNGQDLREMFASATSWLEKSASDIDALNVFPVPDGDTGTNMLLTMRSSMEEAYRAPDRSAAAVAKAMAGGALLGARGNSGVILSQIWRGLAQGLADKESFAQAQASSDKNDLLSVMEAAVSAAQESVANTPSLLQALMDAGVVDAGGQGLYTILEGALYYLRGEVDQMQLR